MRFVVRFDGREAPLIVDVAADGSIAVDDIAVDLSITLLADGRSMVEYAGRVELIDVLGGGGQYEVLHGSRSHRVAVVDERDTWLGTGSGGAAANTVSVAMPGKVVALDVAAGDAVVKGQRVAVVEAMKMENDVKSPRDGVVADVRIAVGDLVEGGQPLIELE